MSDESSVGGTMGKRVVVRASAPQDEAYTRGYADALKHIEAGHYLHVEGTPENPPTVTTYYPPVGPCAGCREVLDAAATLNDRVTYTDIREGLQQVRAHIQCVLDALAKPCTCGGRTGAETLPTP
jgi:hypothetical protein